MPPAWSRARARSPADRPRCRGSARDARRTRSPRHLARFGAGQTARIHERADFGLIPLRTRPPVPAGWRLRPSVNLRTISDGSVLLGGAPLRMLTLSPRGTRLV